MMPILNFKALGIHKDIKWTVSVKLRKSVNVGPKSLLETKDFVNKF